MKKMIIGGLLAATALAAQAGAPVVNIYNWSDYIAPTTVPDFSKKTGIKVRYDNYDSNETLQSKLLTGSSGYDIVTPTSDFMAKQIQAGVYRPLDKSKLPNLKYLDPRLMNIIAQSDPGHRYGVPYMWGTIGVGYDKVKVEKLLGKVPANSMDLLFDPATSGKLAAGGCRIGVQDSASAMLPLALRYIGRDPVNPVKADFDAALAMLKKVRKNISLFVGSPNASELISGELCVFTGYSGAINLAAEKVREQGGKRSIVYDIPSMGSLMWFDGMLIPKTARHPDNAHAFINYILRPDVVAKISNATRYANANLGALKLMDRTLVGNPAIYLSDERKKTLFLQKVQSSDTTRLEGRTWMSFKKG